MKILFFLSVVAINVSSYSMLEKIQLPDSKTLIENLDEAGFSYFIEKTDLIKKLAGRKIYPIGVSNEVNLALVNYNRSLDGDSDMFDAMVMRKSDLVQCILKDHPEAIKSLNEAFKKIGS